MKKIILLFVTLFWSSTILAGGYEHIPDKFFSFLKKGQTDKAIDYLYDTNKWIAKDSDQVINLKSQMAQLDQLVGKYVFHELIAENEIGSKYAHLIYMVGYERQPLRFEIKVYDGGDGWRFQGVSFDASLTDDIEKLANQKLVE